ncbi:hypothetical protein Acr_10g0008180 [Actinidia rufa]|uniref:CCHC-type domain-containing protein n=1 Tax=Actinidia rufa TaxID=165716 RepID=A0A7J0F9Z4_9ERIC|nr:hypothetical protein Acr_10g0008180 [Actinidia rufa]
MPFENNFEVAQPNYGWGFYNSSTYSPPPPWFEEFVYDEPCPLCSSHSHIVTECPRAHEFPEFIRKYINVTQGSQGYVYNEPCLICASHSHLLTECPQAHEFPELFQNDVNTTHGSQEFVYNDPCQICFSYGHIFTKCPNAQEFSEFVQKYNNTTQGRLNPSSNNSYSYTHSHEWETHSNPSWTQEPVASIVSMPYSALSTPQQTQYQPPHWRNEDNELHTKVTNLEQSFINIEQHMEKMNSLLENLIIAQQTQEQKREVEIFYEEDNGDVCDAQSEPCNFEVEIISEDHETLAQDLVTPSKEFTQWENKVELLDCPIKSSIDVGLIDFLGVDKFNGVVEPYLIQLVNNLKTTLFKDGLVVEQQYSRRLKNKKISKYLIIWNGRIQFLSKDLSWDPVLNGDVYSLILVEEERVVVMGCVMVEIWGTRLYHFTLESLVYIALDGLVDCLVDWGSWMNNGGPLGENDTGLSVYYYFATRTLAVKNSLLGANQHSSISALNKLLVSSIYRLPVLKAASDATVDTGGLGTYLDALTAVSVSSDKLSHAPGAWLVEHGVELSSANGLDDPPSWASISKKPDVEKSDGALPPHLHASVDELCLDHTCGGHTYAPTRTILQRLESIAFVHRGVPEEGAEHLFVQRFRETRSFEMGMMVSILSQGKIAASQTISMSCSRQGPSSAKLRKRVVDPITTPIVPILVLSTDLEDSNNLAFSPFQPTGEDVIAHSYFDNDDFDTSSGKVNMALEFKTLGQKKPKAFVDPPAMSNPLTAQDSLPAPNPVLALVAPEVQEKGEMISAFLPSPSTHVELWRPEFSIAVMFPNDVVDLYTECSEEIRDLLVMQQVQSLQGATTISDLMTQQSNELKKSKKKVINLESEMKQANIGLATTEQLKLDLAAIEKARDASYAVATQAQNEVVIDAARAQKDKSLHDLIKLRKVACGLIFERLACLTELRISIDHSAWTKIAPEVELLDSPEPYSPLFCTGFNEEEYMNQPTKKVANRTLRAKASSSGVLRWGKQLENEGMRVKTSIPSHRGQSSAFLGNSIGYLRMIAK